MGKVFRGPSDGVRTVIVLFGIFAAVFGLWLLWGLYGVRWFASQHDNMATLGQTGDLFGGINALFAAFAFAGVGAAAYFQYRTNLMQKQALTITSFEPLFFHLLELHSEAYQRLRLNFDALNKLVFFDYTIYGGYAAASAFRILVGRGQFAQLALRAPGDGLQRDHFTPLLSLFDEFYVDNEDQLGPYYRAFYHVFNLIDLSELSAKTKVRYANIARSTLDKNELLLLMLNCSCPRGESFKGLVENYGLLKHISTDNKNNYLDVALASTLFHGNATRSSSERSEYTAGTPTQGAWWQR